MASHNICGSEVAYTYEGRQQAFSAAHGSMYAIPPAKRSWSVRLFVTLGQLMVVSLFFGVLMALAGWVR